MSAWHLTMYSGFSTLLAQTGVVALGMLGTAAAVGAYAFTVRVTEMVAMFLVAVNAPLMPMLARFHAKADMTNLQATITRASMWALGLSLPVALLLVFGARPVLDYFGPGFPEAVPAMRILALSQLLNVAFGPVGTLLNVTGHERPASRRMAFAALLNLILAPPLIVIAGATGAAISTLVATLTWNIQLSLLGRRKLGVNVGLMALVRHKRT